MKPPAAPSSLRTDLNTTIRLMVTNTFGLYGKLGEFAHAVNSSQPDVVVVTETKLTPDKCTDHEASIPGYSRPLRRDRTAHGGGVAVWVKADLAYQHLHHIQCHDHEVIWLTVTTRTRQKIVVCAVYRPGSCSESDVRILEYLDDTLEAARAHGSKIIIAGDLNVHNTAWLGSTKTTKAGELAEDLCALHGLYQHIVQPTRGLNTLDLVLSDFKSPVHVAVQPPIGHSDHAVLRVDFTIPMYREPKTSRTVWRYNLADWPRLKHDFCSTDWHSMLSGTVDEACFSITAHITRGMKQFIPAKQLKTRPSDPPWWTPECSDSVNAKKAALKRMRTDPGDVARREYKTACRGAALCQETAKSAMHEALRRRLASGSMRDREWWSTAKRAAGEARNSETPVLTDASGATHTSNRDKAEAFGLHFSSKCSLGDQDVLNGVFPEVRRRTDQHIHTVHFRVAAVKAALRKLVPSKATGQDGIPARVLKECASELALPLSKLFTLSFVTGACPAARKIAMVVPVHKKKARSDPRNYRPVSLLPVMSKVMESLINRSLNNFLERQKVLSQHQFGFRRGLGTSDLLTKLHSEWSKAACLGGSVYVLAVDIAGAFDRVSHAGVLHQAACCGVTGDLLTWLKSYLRDRQLKAVVSGQESPLYPVQAGVPQGSILGPTLFLLYVNSCEDVVPDGVKLAVYADDTTLCQVLRTEATILQSHSLLQAAVDEVFAWGAAWKIRFEPSKSQALIIDHHRPAWTVPPICFGGTPVDEESEIKLLGVTFDTHLTFNSHIRSVALRANSRLHLLRRAAPILSPRHREIMYKGFVRPLLEYAPLVWMGSSTTSLAQLDRVQRRALHIISDHTWLPSLSLRRAGPSLLSHTCTSSTASTCPHRSTALFRRKRPRSQAPTPAIPQLRCPAPPTSAVERYSSHRALQPASCFSYRDLPHLEFSPTASPGPSSVARPYAGIQGWRLPLPQASQLAMGY